MICWWQRLAPPLYTAEYEGGRTCRRGDICARCCRAKQVGGTLANSIGGRACFRHARQHGVCLAARSVQLYNAYIWTRSNASARRWHPLTHLGGSLSPRSRGELSRRACHPLASSTSLPLALNNGNV